MGVGIAQPAFGPMELNGVIKEENRERTRRRVDLGSLAFKGLAEEEETHGTERGGRTSVRYQETKYTSRHEGLADSCKKEVVCQWLL